MKKLFTIALALACCLALLAGCGTAAPAPEKKVVNIFTWDGYLPQDVLDDFTAQTGIAVNYANFESNEEMLTKLEAGGAGQYDVVIASDYIIDIARKKGGLLAELDKTQLPNYKNLDESFLSQYYDPQNQHAIPYAAGTPLIVYDPAVVSLDIQGYADLWNTALADSLVLMDDGRNVIGITLKTMGKSFNETDPVVLEEARQKLLTLRPNIRALSYNDPQGVLLSGEASVGYMFTPQVVAVLENRPDMKVVYPKEGMGFGIDSLFMPKNAPNSANAHAFLNFLMDAEIAARVSSQIMYLCPNKAAAPYLPESYKNNASLFIPSEVLGETEFIQDVGEATAIFDKIWTEFKQS